MEGDVLYHDEDEIQEKIFIHAVLYRVFQKE
jgi:hypothetical protein